MALVNMTRSVGGLLVHKKTALRKCHILLPLHISRSFTYPTPQFSTFFDQQLHTPVVMIPVYLALVVANNAMIIWTIGGERRSSCYVITGSLPSIQRALVMAHTSPTPPMSRGNSISCFKSSIFGSQFILLELLLIWRMAVTTCCTHLNIEPPQKHFLQ